MKITRVFGTLIIDCDVFSPSKNIILLYSMQEGCSISGRMQPNDRAWINVAISVFDISPPLLELQNTHVITLYRIVYMMNIST